MICVAVEMLLLGVTLGLFMPSVSRADDLSAQAQKILRARCSSCHGPETANARRPLLLDHRQLLERRLVVPREPDSSALIERVEEGTMPPASRPPVPTDERAVLRDWVRTGALPFPDR